MGNSLVIKHTKPNEPLDQRRRKMCMKDEDIAFIEGIEFALDYRYRVSGEDLERYDELTKKRAEEERNAIMMSIQDKKTCS